MSGMETYEHPISALADVAARVRYVQSEGELRLLDSELSAIEEVIRQRRKRLYAAQIEVERLRAESRRLLVGATILSLLTS